MGTGIRLVRWGVEIEGLVVGVVEVRVGVGVIRLCLVTYC